MDNTTALALAKWDELKRGEQVIASDETLDALSAYFTDHDGPDADRYFRYCASVPNPKRVGIRDQYIVWLKEAPLPANLVGTIWISETGNKWQVTAHNGEQVAVIRLNDDSILRGTYYWHVNSLGLQIKE